MGHILKPVLIITALFLLDQVTKWAVLEQIMRPELFGSKGIGFTDWLAAFEMHRLPFASVSVMPFFNLVMVWNEGISFGVLSDHAGTANRLLLVVLSGIVLGFGVWMVRTRNRMLRLFLAVVIGGAMGNLWDRIRFGGVVDFLDFHAFGYHYPAFNVADSAIVLGMLALILDEITKDR